LRTSVFFRDGKTIQELKLDMVAQAAGLRHRWDVAEVKIITFDGADIGWMQSTARDDALFLGQIFVDAERLGFRITHEDDRKFYMRRLTNSRTAN
jgi:hypothetical protein